MRECNRTNQICRIYSYEYLMNKQCPGYAIRRPRIDGRLLLSGGWIFEFSSTDTHQSRRGEGALSTLSRDQLRQREFLSHSPCSQPLKGDRRGEKVGTTRLPLRSWNFESSSLDTHQSRRRRCHTTNSDDEGF